jgi:ribonuclease P protein component
LAIKKTFRVKRKQDFDTIFANKRSSANRNFVAYHCPNSVGRYRVGISVSKKLGNAVTRNRVKRLIRHGMKELEMHLMPVDIVIIARKGSETLTYQEVVANLRHVLKLAKIYQETQS